MTSHDREFMNRIVSKIAEIDSGEITMYSGDYDFYERERAMREANKEAAYARQQAMLAKEQRFIERFKTHAAKAAQVQSRIKALDKIEKLELPKQRVVVKFEFRDAAAVRRPGRGDRGPAQGLRQAGDLRRPQPDHPPRRALGRDGPERRRQDHAAPDARRRDAARQRRGAPGREPEDGLLRAAVAGPARPGPHRDRAAAGGLPARGRSARCARSPARSSSPATTWTRRSARSRAARSRAS